MNAWPIEPPATPWRFPDPRAADGDVVAVGGDLEPGTILEAYRAGIFPMPIDTRAMGWWSPDPRGVLRPDALRVSRSLRRSCARFEIRIDTAVEAVIDACADPARERGWITAEIGAAYLALHELGWVHSVEAWAVDDGELAGGLYGVCVGGLFAGESMFHLRRDASKAALVGLVELLVSDGVERLIDVQWRTDHLETLGAEEIPRADYLARLPLLTAVQPPSAFVKGTFTT